MPDSILHERSSLAVLPTDCTTARRRFIPSEVVVKAILLIFFLMTGIPAGVQFKQRHDLEERAVTAVRTLHEIYVLTPNQSLRIVYANSWTGNVWMEYVFDDARQQSLIRYAVFEKNSKFMNYDLDQDDIEDRCSMAGTDLTTVAEKELKDETRP
jgi:hypothetical protein